MSAFRSKLSRSAPVMVVVPAMLAALFAYATAAIATATPASASPATTLVFAQAPGGATGGTAFGTQPIVEFQDASNTLVTTDTDTVTLSVVAGTGTTGANLTQPGGTPGSCSAAAVGGIATFVGCSLDLAGSGYTLAATDPADPTLTATSSPFDVTVGSPAQVAFTTQPASIVAGADFASAPTVAVEDAGGNIVTTNADAIGLAVVSAPGTGPLVCGGGEIAAPPGAAPGYKLTAAGGTATFGQCSIDQASASPYQLVAEATDGTTAGTFVTQSAASGFAVSAGAPAKLAFTTSPTGAQGTAAFLTQPVVAIEDAFGNVITTDQSDQVSLAITGGTGTAGATLTCSPASPLTALNGVATFAGCGIDLAGSGYHLTATPTTTSPLTPATSAAFNVTSSGAAHLAFTIEPGGATGGTALSAQPVVTITDAGGNPVSGSVQLALSGGTPGAHLTCGANPGPAGTGTANFSGCSVDLAGTGYQLVATDPAAAGLSVTSATFDVAVGAVAQVAFVTGPSGATGGNAFTGQPIVGVEDLGGNPVPLPGDTVHLAIATGAGPAGARLSCSGDPANTATTSTGLATFAGCAIDKAGTGYQLTASADGLVATTTGTPLSVAAGPAARLVFSAGPTTAIVASPFSIQPQVTITDAGGNPVGPTASPVAVALSVSAGALTCSTNPTSTTTGVAAFTGCQTSSAGTVTLSATATGAGLAGATSAPFSVVAGTPVGHAPVGIALPQTFGGALYSANPTATTDDVNSASGALALAYTDLTVAGIGEAFTLTRQYNSADTTGGSFGPGWTSIFDAGVTVAAGAKTAVVRGEDGQLLVFTHATHGDGWVPPPGARASLSCDGGFCEVSRFDGVSFDSSGGHIVDYRSPRGWGLRFNYTAGQLSAVVLQTSGSPLVVTVTENATGQVTRVTTPTRSVSYSYTGSALTGFTDADGNRWTYTYGPGLTQVIDPVGQVRLSVVYSGGRVTSAQSLGSPKHFSDTYAWNAATQVSTRTAVVQTASGPATGAYFDHYQSNVLVNQQLPDGASTSYSYDAKLDLVAVQDPLGHVQQMTYSPAGDMVTQTNPASAGASSTTRMRYDGDHRVVAVTDPNGNTTTYAYLGSDTFVTPPGPPSGYTYYHYNFFGELALVENPTGFETYSYDNAGNETGFELWDLRGRPLNGFGPVTTYNEAGSQLLTTDARGHGPAGLNPAYQTAYTYDPVGNLLTTTAPGPQTTATTYTAAGDVFSVTNPNGQTTTYTWSEPALTKTAASTAGNATWTYDPSGSLLTQTDLGGRKTIYTYDTTGRQGSVTDPANVTTTYSDDLEGNVIASSDTAGHTATYAYDPQNRPTTSTVNGVTTTSAYDPAGNVITQTDGGGHRTSYTYNSHEKVASVSTAAGTTSYRYDLSDNLISTVDGNGHTTSYAVNGAGQRTAMSVNGHTWTYAYDVANNLISASDPDGRTTNYTLNAQDLRTGITYSQAGQATINVTQQFDAAGRRVAMTDPTTGTHTFSYDAGGNLTSAANGANNTFSYDYTVAGKVTETYPDGTSNTLSYDDAHNVMSLTAPGVNVSYVRNTARQITGVAYSNGLFETQSYNQAGQIAGQSLTCGGATALASAWSFDAAGNPLATATTLGSTTTLSGYGYDAANRLAAQSVTSGPAASPTTGSVECTTGTPSPPGAPQQNDNSGGTTDTTAPTAANQPVGPTVAVPGTGTTANPITYDAVGNRTSAGGTSFAYNAADEITTATGATYSYDNAGDVTAVTIGGVSTQYSYDAADRLIKVVKGSTTVAYAYDGDGNRTSQTVSGPLGTTVINYSWDISGNVPLLVLERDASYNLIRRYLYGSGPVALQTPAGTYYYQTDQQGDVTALSDQTGAIVESYTYDGFGHVTANQAGINPGPVNPLLFQGQYLDPATGLYDMRARNYDPTSGRFTQRDPVVPSVGSPVVSPYVFAADQPTASGDATGMLPSEVNAALNGHSVESASTVADVGLGLPVLKVAAKGVVKVAAYFGAFEEASVAAGSQAFADGANIADALQIGADTRGGAPVAGAVGKFLSVAGIGLSAYVTVEDCEYGSVQQCVGDTVGLAFAVGCLAISDGIGSVACSLLGAGLSFAISHYGPQIVQGLADLGGYEVEGLTIAINAVAAGFSAAGAAIVGGFATAAAAVATGVVTAVNAISSGVSSAVGAVATGINEAVSAISSGFTSAVSTLEQAGYSAAQLAFVLKNVFNEGVNAVVNELASLAYDVDGVAAALARTFSLVAQQAAAILQSFQYGVNQIATGLKTAFAATAAVAAQVLQALGYTINQIAGALNTAFVATAAVAAAVLQALGYTIHQIAGALVTAFNATAQVAAAIFQGLNYTANQIAGALVSAFNAAAATVTTILQGLSYGLAQIAGALSTAFNFIDAQVAAVFQSVGVAVSDIAGALQSAFGDVDVAVAQLLATLGYTADDIAGALQSAFGDAAAAVAGVLKAIGETAATISAVLGDVFGEAVSAIENVLSDIGFSSSVIDSIGGAFTSFGNAVANAFESAFSWL